VKHATHLLAHVLVALGVEFLTGNTVVVGWLGGRIMGNVGVRILRGKKCVVAS